MTEIGNVTKNLKLGEISSVVQTSLGKHMLYIYEEEYPQDLDCNNISEDQNEKFSNTLYSQKREALIDTYMDELYACANVEIKDVGTSGLPNISSLPKVERENVNCQSRRVMLLPEKKKKKKKEKKRNRK